MVKKRPAPSSIQTTTYWKSQVVSVSMNWATGLRSREAAGYSRTSKLRVPTDSPFRNTSTR